MKTVKLIPAVIAAAMLCSCSRGSASSEGIKEIMSQASELNNTEEYEYACLPDSVSLEEGEFARRLTADSSGYISYDKMGLSFKPPYGDTALIYEKDIEKHRDETNPTCQAAIFMLNANFPHSHEYIRAGLMTNIMGMGTSYDTYCEFKDGYINKLNNREEYRTEIFEELKKLLPALISCEGLDGYDYVGLDSSKQEWLDFNFTGEDGEVIVNDMLNVLPVMNIFRTPAPDSSVGEISAEVTELENGYYCAKLTYELTRNGIAMDKVVYHIIDPNSEEKLPFMRRIEFSKDKGAVWYCEPDTFLKSVSFYEPTFANPDDVTDYFGNNVQEQAED